VSTRRALEATPTRVFARLCGATTLAACATALGVAWLLPLALGPDFAAGARALAWSFAVGGTAMCALLAADTLRRVRSLHGYFARLTRTDDAVPPSEAAVRDALSAPDRFAATFTLCAAGITLADALGVARVTDVPLASARALLDVAAWLVVSLAAWPLRLGAEWALFAWLGRIDPEELTEVPLRSLTRGLALRGAWAPAAATLLAATGAAARAHSGAPLLVGVPLAIGAGALAYALTRRAAEGTAQDLRALTALAASLGPETGREPPSAKPVDRESAELHAALVALGERLGTVRANEERAQRAMSEAQRLKTQFLASMSHDLRSPLNSILGFSEVLLGGLDGELVDAQRESVRAIQRAGEDLLRLLTEVLDSARLEAGRLELRRAWTPSVEILTEAVRRGMLIASERTEVTGRALSIDAELQPGLPPVYVDRERIVQAVVGLFGHAARAMEGGTIRLRARIAQGAGESPAEVRVDVTDTGGGIPESERERIFDAFRGVRGGRRLEGLGLGLALARALVRAHDGEVSVASAADGITFTVALSTAGPAPTDAPPRRAPRPASR
jgi:signal transduction histidine kinase